ncbi:MAG: aminotransferase class I/II-fold pyridoxal phosphate-dependent enzyme [Candidatus Methanoperedens sp.]|nr:aminotransferase class I/II-fold pyridoxal phosphate-dependent enzyme [Candidatus Methanoperedens sp.]MCZ7369534.1 aminotransferase class I/II-fold pyridoxal phosphate-dependent enzyme [Candidatus Methanoperedens sp.]
MLSRRVDHFVESVIRDMTRLSIKHGAINLAQGFPDFPAPQELKRAAASAIMEDYNQYSITWGAKDLREEIARKAINYNYIDVDPESEVTVTCGSTEAMMASMLALINEGDEVVLFEPFYENYGPDAAVSGAVPHLVPLDGDNNIDEDALVSAFNKKTRALILNTPNNPCGKVFSKDELSLIADLCEEHDVIAVTDEIYEYILYDGRKHISIGSLDKMKDRTITISGFSKTYSVTGWRIGYALAEKTLTSAIRKVHDFLTVGAPAPLQHACVTALQFPDSYYEELARMYDGKRMLLYKALIKSGFKCKLPEGAYYILADIPECAGMDDMAFAKYLVSEVGVAAVPGSSFYRSETGKHKLRFTFSKKDETLMEAARRLEDLSI